MDRMPNAADLTAGELTSLTSVSRGFICATIPKAHQARLIELAWSRRYWAAWWSRPWARWWRAP